MNNSKTGRFYIRKALGYILKFFLICYVAYLLLFGYLYISTQQPPSDSTYVGYLEFNTKDTLHSCRVLRKKYIGGEYHGAIYQLNESDFNKTLNEVRSSKYLLKDTVAKFDEKIIKLALKENIKVEDLDYIYNLYGGHKRFGFKSPDIIIYEAKYD